MKNNRSENEELKLRMQGNYLIIEKSGYHLMLDKENIIELKSFLQEIKDEK